MSEKLDKRQLAARTIRMICSLGLSKKMSIRQIARHENVAPNSVRSILSRATLMNFADAYDINILPDVRLLNLFYPDLKPSLNAVPDTVDKNSKFIPDFTALGKRQLEKHLEAYEIYNYYLEKSSAAGGNPFSRAYFYRRLSKVVEELNACDSFYFAQDFKYGHHVEIDFSGDSYMLNTFNGMQKCYLCVVTWPASYYTYAEFVTAQSTFESCRVFSNAVRYWGNRVPLFCICDNAKSWVTKHVGKDVIINPAFENYMAALGIVIDAAPPYKPQYKSAVEYSVCLLEDFTKKKLTEFNDKKTISDHSIHLMSLVEKDINEGPFRESIDKTRSFLFHSYEQPAARAISSIPAYEGEFTTVTVPRSYQLDIHGHFYSVPYTYIKKKVDVFLSGDFVVIKYEGTEIARHLRTDNDGERTVTPAHMPAMHQEIVRSNAEIQNDEDLLNYCKTFNDPYLYKFCIKR